MEFISISAILDLLWTLFILVLIFVNYKICYSNSRWLNFRLRTSYCLQKHGLPMQKNTKSVKCGFCFGTGKVSLRSGRTGCRSCNATGKIVVPVSYEKCTKCKGTGRNNGWSRRCTTCNATGWRWKLKYFNQAYYMIFTLFQRHDIKEAN